MEVNCEGCAGCCLNWRSHLESVTDRTEIEGQRDQRGPHEPAGDGPRWAPLDDDSNFVPLTRDEVRSFLDRGMAAALTPRFWHAADDSEGVDIDGISVAAIAGRPVFFVGLRKPPKPVAPFGREEATWLPACVFLDPTTLQCRIHDDPLFPDECGAYPEHNLALDQETECERVEAAFGGDRLVDDSHDDPDGLLLGPQAIGAKLFRHPVPERLEGIVERAASGSLTATDRAEPIAVAAASSPGTIAISEHHYERARERALATDDADGAKEPEATGDGRGANWVGPAIREWIERHQQADETVPPSTVAKTIEDERGAPETPGWDAVD